MPSRSDREHGPRFIFVTGGVVSSLGKGIASASIGKLLVARGFTVALQKFDPYINVDPGTMSPYQHGEVYVTENPRATSSLPIDAEAMPLPSDDTTPPVTKMKRGPCSRSDLDGISAFPPSLDVGALALAARLRKLRATPRRSERARARSDRSERRGRNRSRPGGRGAARVDHRGL